VGCTELASLRNQFFSCWPGQDLKPALRAFRRPSTVLVEPGKRVIPKRVQRFSDKIMRKQKSEWDDDSKKVIHSERKVRRADKPV
jgi:hypothetical protein